MYEDKALFDYWHDRVELKNWDLMASPDHVQTHVLRHECTNYDELRKSSAVRRLDELERSRVITVIKYQCTARVLQNRARQLRERVDKIEQTYYQQEQQKSKLLNIIRALQEKIFGKDNQIDNLKKQISVLKVENEAFRTDAENSKAEAELREALERLQKQYEDLQKKRQKLARNNQSLGGRVAHAERYRKQRDEAKDIVKQQQRQINTLEKENQCLQQENENLRQALK